MPPKKIVDVEMLLALNPEYAQALARGEEWALRHARTCDSLNAGEPEGFRRPFDGKPRKWCGAACPAEEGCVMCTLPENPEMARLNREHKHDPMTLARAGIITVSGDVDDAMVARVRDMLAQAEGCNELKIKIESNGGFLEAGVAIHDMIRDAPVKKRVGVVREYARSAAAIVLQACDERVAAPQARILIHHTRLREVTLKTLENIDRVKFIVEMSKPLQKRRSEILVGRTGRTLSEIERVCDTETDMTSAEALEFGLIDAIGE